MGEASHPGPPKSLLRRQLLDHTSRNVAARISVSPSPCATLFDVDVLSSIPPTVPASSGAVAHVEVAQGDSGRVRVVDVVDEVVSRRVRRVSSDSDVPVVTRGNRFAVLSESDNESDNEPFEDDVITIPASSGAVAALLEQCETGFQVLSQPLPTCCDVDNRLGGHGSVGESHVRPTEVDIQDTAISSDGGGQDLVRDNETQAAVEVFAMSECSDTESCREAPQFGRARSRRRLRLVSDDPQTDVHVHDGTAGMSGRHEVFDSHDQRFVWVS